MQFADVNSRFRISPTPPHRPGVYLFVDESDRIMYAGMAHDLEKVLYRYQGLKGRQAMRDRAAAGEIAKVAWVVCGSPMTAPSLEQLAIRRYRPPWNTQHNAMPRSQGDALVLDADEQRWVEEASRMLDSTLRMLLPEA